MSTLTKAKGKLQCKLGWHQWGTPTGNITVSLAIPVLYTEADDSVQAASSGVYVRVKECTRCGKVKRSDYVL